MSDFIALQIFHCHVVLCMTLYHFCVFCFLSGAGWFCDKVIVRQQVRDTDSQSFYFPCGQWLDRGHSDGLIERTLWPQQPPALVQEQSEVAEEDPETKPSKFWNFSITEM